MKKILSIGLLILLSVSYIFGQDKVMNADAGFFIYLNGSKTKITEDDYLIYAKGFEEENYNKYRNDEFEWHEQFQIMKKNFDKKIQEADLSSTYTIVTSVDFGDYDFTNEGFPVSISADTFFPLGKNSSYWVRSNSGTVFSKQTALKLNDFHKYNFFKYAKNDAKTFLQTRKNSYGNVDRSVTLMISYKVASYDSAEYKNFEKIALSNDYLPVVGNIENIEVYDASNQRNIKKIGTLIQK